jgi:hypothetical protein
VKATPSLPAIPETSKETFRLNGRGLLRGSRFRLFDKAAHNFCEVFDKRWRARESKEAIERYENANLHHTHRWAQT